LELGDQDFRDLFIYLRERNRARACVGAGGGAEEEGDKPTPH